MDRLIAGADPRDDHHASHVPTGQSGRRVGGAIDCLMARTDPRDNHHACQMPDGQSGRRGAGAMDCLMAGVDPRDDHHASHVPAGQSGRRVGGAIDFLMAQADDERWRSFADVIIHREVCAEPVGVAERTLDEWPGCVVVVVAVGNGRCVLVAREKKPVVVEGDVERVAVEAYRRLVSLARVESDLGSESWS
jgi:hypothetical protein